MSFSSNGTSSLCNKVEGEVVGSSPTECVCNLPIIKMKKKKKKVVQLELSDVGWSIVIIVMKEPRMFTT
jgi:hypothetical protein